MSLPNPGWSVTFGETPTAAKWSELGANDDALAAGTGLTAGAIVPNALMASTGTSWVWQSWTPTWANLTVGNGVNASTYSQIGKTVVYKLKFTLGTSSVVGTAPNFTLPVTSVSYGSPYNAIIGAGILGAGGNFPGAAWWLSTTTAEVETYNASATTLVGQGTTATVPGTWASTHFIQILGMYQAA